MKKKSTFILSTLSKVYVFITLFLFLSSPLISFAQPSIKTDQGLGKYGYIERDASATYFRLQNGKYGNIYNYVVRSYINGSTNNYVYMAALPSGCTRGDENTNNYSFGSGTLNNGSIVYSSVAVEYCGPTYSHGSMTPTGACFNERQYKVLDVTADNTGLVSSVSPNTDNLVLSFKIDPGGISGRVLNRLWIHNDGTTAESSDINNSGFKLFYENVTGSETFNGSESNVQLYGDYGGNSTSNNDYGNNALGAISIPTGGLRCYIVLNQMNGTTSCTKTVQVSIIADGISLDNNSNADNNSLVRIDKTPTTGASKTVVCNSITTSAISGSPFCAGSSVSVPYTISGTFTGGNVFTAQLSNSAGSFASPTSIGTLTSTAAGTISATIPGGTPTGTGYRIRVISSTPSVTGSDNGTNLTVTTAGTWLGTTNTDWNTSTNWSCGTIPTSSTNVTIPSGGNQPTISTGATAVANSITINSGATLTLSGSTGLNITSGGTITNNGTFTSASCPSNIVTFLGTGTINGANVCTFPNLALTGVVTLVKDINITGNLTTGAQKINSGYTVTFNGSCAGGQTITRTGGGVEYFSKMIIDKTAGNVILSSSPATNVSINDPSPATNIGVTTLTIKNAGKLDINGQTFTMNGGAGGTGSPVNGRAAILVDGASGGVTKTILSTIADGTFNIRGTFRAGLAGVEVNGTNGGKLLFDNYVNVNTNIGFGPTDITTIGYKLELLGVSAYNGGFVSDLNNTNSANGHPVYAIGSTLIYNNVVGVPFDRNREWDASGVGTAGVTPGYPYNVLIKGNSKVDIGINTTSGIDNRAIANDLTIEAGSALDMNVMDQTNHHLTIGRDITFAGKLMLGHGTTSNNPFVGDILVGRNWTRTGTTSIFDPNETGTGYSAANTQTVISNVTSNIKARAVTFFGTEASTIKAPRNTVRDINGVFGGETFPYLKLDKTNTANTLTNDTSSIAITRELFLTKGTLNLGDSNIVIVSNLYRTADVAQITTPANVVVNYNKNGRFSLQRFIYNQSTVRSWRFLTAPLQASDPISINDAWQAGAVNPVKTNPAPYNPWPSKAGSWCGLSAWPGFGTHITNNSGTYDGTNGFDDGTNTASLKWYNNTGATTVWGYPSSTKSTPLMSKLAWSFFVRGDRGFVIGDQYVPAATTILEPRGKINIGDVTSTVIAGKTNLIGNPYACQINMTNVSVGGVTKKNFKLWDPKAFANYTNTGKYIPFTWISGTTYAASNSPVTTWVNPGTVESSEAFFCDNIATSSVVFHESDKVSGVSSLNGIQSRPVISNRPANDIVSFFRVNLAFYNVAESGYTSIDGTLNLYNPLYNSAVDNEEDVISPIGSNTGAIRIAKDGFQLAISKETTIDKVDTIFLALSPLQKLSHELILTTTDFVPDVEATLVDKYLNTVTPFVIGDTDTLFYPFEITSDALSNRTDRFMIVLKPTGTLPVKFVNVKASQQSKDILVEWKAENEMNTKEYNIERSSDGRTFSMIYTAQINNDNSGKYSFVDKQVESIGTVYYRIVNLSKTGERSYSSIVKVNSGNESSVSLINNPLNNGAVEIQIKNMPKGKYTFNLLNMLGQKLISKEVNINATNYTDNIFIGSVKARGTYQLEITDPNNKQSNIKVLY